MPTVLYQMFNLCSSQSILTETMLQLLLVMSKVGTPMNMLMLTEITLKPHFNTRIGSLVNFIRCVRKMFLFVSPVFQVD